ncbi:hypothetical protein EV127DRAFT_462073 [Xylaria flabelliformis]|nr:hypothetical protein EV127DRAFT_462073 [Xylaria flabelliformis]
MAAITIKQSFRNPLPSYPNPLGVGDTHISGSTTMDTDPPRFYVAISHDAWVGLGFQSLETVNTRALENEHISLREDAMYHLNEGDVARAAAMYLLHPINQALSAIPNFAGSIKCLSEQLMNGVRADISFMRYRGNEQRCFAVVEFKKRGVIDDNEFRQAARTLKTPVSHHVKAAMNAPGGSFFQRNSVKLMKQAAAYATRNGTQYVALFNWDRLVLIRFSMLDPRRKIGDLVANGVGDYCEIGVLKYDTGSHLMRAALLGFLMEAYHQTP